MLSGRNVIKIRNIRFHEPRAGR